MKLLILILTMLFINGCGEIRLCDPQPCVSLYPTLPTYRVPVTKPLTPPKALGNGMYAVKGKDLKGCLEANARLRKICNNYAVINKRVNKEYQRNKK